MDGNRYKTLSEYRKLMCLQEGLSFSDYFDDSIPNEQKPPYMLRPMEEDDYPIQAKDLFAGLWEEDDLRLKSIIKGIANEVQHAQGLKGDDLRKNWWEAEDIFIVFSKGLVVVQRKTSDDTVEYFSTNKRLEAALNAKKGFTTGLSMDSRMRTHTRLESYVKNESWNVGITIHGEHPWVIAGRTFKFPNYWVVGFWQKIEKVRENWNDVKWALDVCQIDPKTAYYNFEDIWDEHYQYWEVVGDTKQKTSDPKKLELMRLAHLNPDVKKKLLTKYPPNRLQQLADKLGLPLIGLKYALGKIDESKK